MLSKPGQAQLHMQKTTIPKAQSDIDSMLNQLMDRTGRNRVVKHHSLLLQAMYEQAARCLMSLGAAVQRVFGSAGTSGSDDAEAGALSNKQQGSFKVAASVTRLQRKVASW